MVVRRLMTRRIFMYPDIGAVNYTMCDKKEAVIE